jgi:hypothetical protein
LIKLQPPRSFRIRAIDESGAPLAGVKIGPDSLVFGRGATELSKAVIEVIGVVTDRNGRAELQCLPANCSPHFAVLDNRYVSKRRALSPVSYSAENVRVFGLACSVEGVVTMDGKPVPNVAVFARLDRSDTGSTTTDDQGRFSFRQQPEGSIELWSTLPWQISSTWVSRPVILNTRAKGPNHAEIRLERGVQVSGRVVEKSGAPASLARVEFGDPRRYYFFELNMTVAEDGKFRAALSPGKHSVFVYYGPSRTETSITVSPHGPNDFTLVAADFPKDQRQQTIVCQVLDAGGKPAERAGIEYQYPYGRSYASGFSETDSHGIANVKLTEIQARAAIFKAEMNDQFSGLALKPIDNKLTIRLHRVPLGSVSGKVVDERNKPVSGAKVEISFLSRERNTFLGDLTTVFAGPPQTGEDGKFQFKGLFPNTPIWIHVTAPGYKNGQSEAHRILGSKDITLPDIHLQHSR